MRKQGIDVSSIDIIIQWKATCNMDTLLQRFGRGARDPQRFAWAILFAEPSHFDDERQRIEEARLQRIDQQKRKATAQLTGIANKRRATSSKGNKENTAPAPAVVPVTPTTSNNTAAQATGQVGDAAPPPVEEYDENERWHIYNTTSDKMLKTKSSSKSLDPAIDDLINAHFRPVKCRRRPTRIYSKLKGVGGYFKINRVRTCSCTNMV